MLQKCFVCSVARKFSIGGLCVSAGGTWHSKNWQKLHWFIVFHVSIWGSELCLGRLSPPKLPRDDGTGMQAWHRPETFCPSPTRLTTLRWIVPRRYAAEWTTTVASGPLSVNFPTKHRLEYFIFLLLARYAPKGAHLLGYQRGSIQRCVTDVAPNCPLDRKMCVTHRF